MGAVSARLQPCSCSVQTVALGGDNEFWTNWNVFRIWSRFSTFRPEDIFEGGKLCKLSDSSCWWHILRCSCIRRLNSSCCRCARKMTAIRRKLLVKYLWNLWILEYLFIWTQNIKQLYYGDITAYFHEIHFF